MPLRIAITPGEPAGVGPDLAIELAQRQWGEQLIAVADPDLLAQRAKALNLPLTLLPWDPQQQQPPQQAGELYVLPVFLQQEVIPGQLNADNGGYVVETLRQACAGNMNRQFDAVVTGPVHKGIINQSGVLFSGHTEFFANQSHTNDVVMMLSTQGLRVALVTTHIPLAHVAKAITAERLHKVISIIHGDLKRKFAISEPHIFVCGLNPHAGESGHMGKEETQIIEPALQQLREQGIKITGPLPADTIFQPKYMQQADVILAMYHDQGLPVLKFKGFKAAVNITLGLPFVRTSVDHGTALDLAGTGQASAGSFIYALEQAIQLAKNTPQFERENVA